MRGLGAVHTEVARRAHDAFAEVPGPDTIDDHARGQRVAWVSDPISKRFASLRIGRLVAELHDVAEVR